MLRSQLIALLAFVFVAASGQAASAQVQDNAHIFSNDAVATATVALKKMNAEHHKQLVIETYAEVEPDREAALNTAGKDRFFRDWMSDRANAGRVNGVMVLVCMKPRYVVVGAGVNTRTSGLFTADDIKRLRELLQKDFHAGRYDSGLGEAIDMVDQTLTAHATSRPSTQPTTRAAAG